MHETRGSSRGASRVEGQELRFCTGLTTNPEGRGSGQEWRFCTRLAAISAREPYRTWNGDSVRDSRQFHRARARAKYSDSARDSRQIRHSQRVRGRAIHGTRTGDPGMMILCETLDNSRGSGAVTPDRTAALSQHGYGHCCVRKITEAGEEKRFLARDPWPRIPGQGHAPYCP